MLSLGQLGFVAHQIKLKQFFKTFNQKRHLREVIIKVWHYVELRDLSTKLDSSIVKLPPTLLNFVTLAKLYNENYLNKY